MENLSKTIKMKKKYQVETLESQVTATTAEMVDDQLQDEDRQSGIPIPEDERESPTCGLGVWNSGEVTHTKLV